MIASVLAGASLVLPQLMRRHWTLVGALIVAASLLLSSGARSILAWGERASHTGISDPVPTVYTYTLLVMCYGLWLIVRPGAARLALTHLIFVVSIVFVTMVEFASNEIVISGTLHLLTAVVAWSLGDFVGRRFANSSRITIRHVAYGLLAVVAIELFASLLQMAGGTLAVFGIEVVGVAPHGRVTGTFGHPTAVGKFLFILLLLLLPLSRSIDRRASVAAWSSIAIAAVVIGMSQSRANLIAVVSALFVWILLTPQSRRVGSRIAALIIMIAVFVPFVNPILDRFTSDPDGGDRPELLAAGLIQIRESPIIGTGPNNYVPTVGAWDHVTATGFPIHNSFLLLVAELGIPMALLFLWPWLRGSLVAVSVWVRGSSTTPYAGAVVATLPGMLLILNTGWGMLNRELLIAWFFFAAIAVAVTFKERDKLRGEAIDLARSKTRASSNRQRSTKAGST